MRKEIYRLGRDEATALLERAPVVHVASTTADGSPLLRTVHGVIRRGFVAFHGAPAGEKMLALGRPAVVSAEEVVAPIPSYFVDPERACPATTYYRAAQVHGVLEPVTDAEEKADVLCALMDKYQPEGEHVPIAAHHPLYEKAIRGLLVVRVSLERIDGKAKLGQNRTPAELGRILEQLWARGGAGDPHAIELVRAANPDAETPRFLSLGAPAGVRLVCALEASDADAAAALLAREYWLTDVASETIAQAHVASTAWVGARDEHGALVATARAMSDGAMHAFVYDVCVAEAWRGRGLGSGVVRLLLDHPAVRRARSVRLTTRDAQALYAKLGFKDVLEAPLRPWPSTEMRLSRASARATQ